MHHGASSCVHTLADAIPVRIAGLPRGGRTVFSVFGMLSAIVCAIALTGTGCSSTAPRFRQADATGTSEDEVRAGESSREEEPRFDPGSAVTVASLPPPRATAMKYSNLTPPGINRDGVLLDVVSLLGVPYAYGGSDRRGMDCSGFTASVYESAFHHALPRSTREQYLQGVRVELEDVQFGDLVFFNTTGESPSHVGIYLEDDLFVHASATYGVTISSLESAYYRERIVGIRRIVE